METVTTLAVLADVREYLPALAARYDLAREALEAQFRLLPLVVYRPEEYADRRVEAMRRMARRDPDDADLLALALSLRVPVWSNDRDFEAARVPWFTNSQLLKALAEGAT